MNDPIVLALQRQTATIRAQLERLRDGDAKARLEIGQQSAESALSAASSAYSLTSGEEWVAGTQGRMRAGKRTTLLAGGRAQAPGRASSAAVSAITNAPIATSSAAAVTETRSTIQPVYSGGGGKLSYRQMLE